MKFHLNSNIVEGTPEELVKYQELLEEKEADLLRFGHEHQLTETEQRAKGNFKGLLGSLKVLDSYTESTEISTDEAETSSTELQVGDRVKVLKSKHRAEGEATVTAVREDGKVKLAGTNKKGRYLTNWSNHVSDLEKIEEEEEDIKGYTFWYLEGSTFNNRTVLKTTLGDYFEDSKGRRYAYQAIHGLINPINRENVREEFEEAKHSGGILKYYPALDVFIKEY